MAIASSAARHAVNLRVGLHQVLHDLQRLQPLVVAGLGGEQLDVLVFLDRVVEAAHPVDIGERALDPLNDDDVALSADPP